MAYKFEDGKGSRNRTTIFNKRLRVHTVGTSLIASISAERSSPLPHETIIGVFDTTATTSVAGSGGSLLYLANNDAAHAILIDRIYTNEIASSTVLPDTSTFISIRMNSTININTGTQMPVINENQSVVNVIPDITISNGATTSGGVELMRRYVNISRTYRQEPIVQRSDGIILARQDTMEVFLSTMSSTTVGVFMKFAVVNVEALGLPIATNFK